MRRLLLAASLSCCATPTWADPLSPLIDYHVHLLGPYALPVFPTLPEVSVPAGIRKLLNARAALHGVLPEQQDLPSVYTRDAIVLDTLRDSRWLNRDEIGAYLEEFVHDDWHFAPERFVTGGSAAFVAGTVIHVPSKQHVLNFELGLRRTPGGWRIVTDSTTIRKPPRFSQPITADRLIRDLDSAGIQRALVLSEAFWVGGVGAEKIKRLKPAPNKRAAVELENDWTLEQVRRYPGRLVMACGVDVLSDFASAEIDRCSKFPEVRAIKLNIGGGGENLDLHNLRHIAKLRELFRFANQQGIAIVIHMGSLGGFGAPEVRIFLDQVMSAAPDIPVQIAHLSNGFQNEEALAEFAKARAAGEVAAKNLYFDMSAGSFADLDPKKTRFIVESIRKIGLTHVLYGSDEQPGDQHAPTAQNWQEMHQALPLTEDEWHIIAGNVAPYMK